MYSILLNDNNELLVTHKERIMQRSKLVDSFRILLKKEYKDTIDMSDFSASLEYILPVSKKYKSETLTMVESETEEGYLECSLPFDTAFTTEAGEIEMQITLVELVMDEDGKITQYIRKSSTCDVTIVPISAWSDIVPDEALTAIDQKLVQAQALISELNDIADELDKSKADNIKVDLLPNTNEGNKYLYLTSNGDKIGDAIDLDDLGSDISEDDTEGLIRVII